MTQKFCFQLSAVKNCGSICTFFKKGDGCFLSGLPLLGSQKSRLLQKVQRKNPGGIMMECVLG